MKPGVFLYTIGLGWPERLEFFHQQAVAEGGTSHEKNFGNQILEQVLCIENGFGKGSAAGSMSQAMNPHESLFF